MRIIFAFISLIIFFVFLRTAPPTIYLGDSGEIVAAAYNMGIGHPPGYPLFMLGAKIASFVPLGDIGFRINLFSVFLGILCFLLFYLTGVEFVKFLFKINKKGILPVKLTALALALIYTFSNIFWFQAVHAKGAIYTFMHLAVLLAIFVVLKFKTTKENKYFYLAFYLAGFLTVVHQSTLLFTVFIVAILLADNIKKLYYKRTFLGILFFLTAAISPYLYLFIRMKTRAAVQWSNISTFSQLISHILRRIYFPNSSYIWVLPDVLIFRLKYYMEECVRNYNILVIFFLIGLFILYKKNKKLFIGISGFLVLNYTALVLGVNTVAGFAPNSISPFFMYTTKNFYMMNEILAMIISIAGLYGAVELFIRNDNSKKTPLFIFLFMVPVAMVLGNYKLNDLSRNYLTYDRAENIFKTLKNGDILFANEDFDVFSILYTQYVRRAYRNIRTIDMAGTFLDTSIYKDLKNSEIKVVFNNKVPGAEKFKFQLTQMIKNNAELDIFKQNPRKVYYASFTEYTKEKFRTKPYSVIFKLYKEDEKTPDSERLLKFCSIRDYYNNKNLDLYCKDVLARYFLQKARFAAVNSDIEVFEKYRQVAEELAGECGDILNLICSIYLYDLKKPEYAVKYMEKILELDPYDYKSLNVLIKLCMEYDPEKAIEWLKYLYSKIDDEQQRNNILVTITKIKEMLEKETNGAGSNLH